MKKKFLPVLLLLISIGFAAKDIIPYRNGYIYTDEMRSKIYYYNEGSQVLLQSPGVGYYYSLSAEHDLLGFKWREFPGGPEAPAILDLRSGRVTLLHEAVPRAGQVSFSVNGEYAFTIGESLYVEREGERREYDLGTYANIAPISPDGKYAVFNDRNDQLWIMDLKNEEKLCITDRDYGNVMPSWSPDSRFISYYTLNGDLKIYDREKNENIIVGKGAGLRWSEEPGEFAYTRIELDDRGGIVNTDILLKDIDGNIRFDTESADEMETDPCFLPGGSLLYMKDRNLLKHAQGNSLRKDSGNEDPPPALATDPVYYDQSTPAADSYLDIPYIHQVYDTPGPRGYSSCAPTTAAMIMAYYNILPAWPFRSGFGNWNDYGAYVHERYYHNGYYFDLSYRDCNTAETSCYTCYGGMGYMWTGGSPNSRMAGYYERHGMNAAQTWNTSWSNVAEEIDKEVPFSICNYLSGGGHLIAAVGRVANGQRTVIANDPYGNKNTSNWPSYDGKAVYYDWPGYNHGHVSLNDANSSYTSMPWCIATSYQSVSAADSLVDDREFNEGFYMHLYSDTVPMRYYRSKNSGYGEHHWWTYTETGENDICYVTWTPALDSSAYYEIKAYIPGNATASSAVYRIEHAAGNSRVIIDQSSAADTWVSLGKYLFRNDGLNYVYLGDSTGTAGEIIAFDAVKWESADQQELDFSADYRTGMPDYDITFTAVSGLPDGEYDYIWDFGDGSTAHGETVTHHYRNEGMYSVELSVRAGDAEISVRKENYIMIIRNISGDFDLINPDSMEVVNTQNPLLFWEPVRNTEKYLIYIGETLDLSGMQALESDTNMIRIEEALPENKTIYWHVKAVSAALDTLASTFWRFQVNSRNTPPSVFSLILPEDGSISDTLRPYFSWEPSSDEDPQDSLYYELYAGTHIDSMDRLYRGNDNSFCAEENLKENGRYRWRVAAVDAAGARTFSESSGNFSVNTINEAPPAPRQLTPVNNSYQITRSPYFSWTPVEDPDPGDMITYRIYYWKDGSTRVYSDFTLDPYFSDRSLMDNSKYNWTVAARDPHGLSAFSDTLTVYIDTELDVAEIPEEFRLDGNYPNPFNPVTQISYAIPRDVRVNLSIYDLSGKLLLTLADAYQPAGRYRVNFDGNAFSSGVYLYTLQAGDFRQTKKMLLMK